MKLSIIVPCYNVEQYVEKCIDCLENQDISRDEYEILAYNDESTDGTLAILERLEQEYPNIKVASHKNKGLSGTRNRGIREAQGDFIWFVDSDDWIEDNCLSNISQLLTNDIDVLAFSGFIPEGGRVEHSQCYNNKVVDKETLFTQGFADAAQFYIYRRDFILSSNCFFKEGIKHEDTLFTPITLHKVQNIVFYRIPVYHFLQRAGSITTVIDIKRIHDLAGNFIELYKYSSKLENEKIKLGFLNHMAHHITEMLNYGIDNGKEGKMLIKQIMHDHPEYWEIMKNAIDFKPKAIYWAVKLSPLPFITTYSFIAKFR